MDDNRLVKIARDEKPRGRNKGRSMERWRDSIIWKQAKAYVKKKELLYDLHHCLNGVVWRGKGGGHPTPC